MFNSLEVSLRTPLMRKSQFHPFRNNLKPSRKNLNLPEKFLPPSPFPLPPKIAELSLKQSHTIELNLIHFRKIPTPREKILTPHPPKKIQPPWKFLNPPEISQPP